MELMKAWMEDLAPAWTFSGKEFAMVSMRESTSFPCHTVRTMLRISSVTRVENL